MYAFKYTEIDQAPPLHREAVRLRYAGLTPVEIAESVGLSESEVDNIIHFPVNQEHIERLQDMERDVAADVADEMFIAMVEAFDQMYAKLRAEELTFNQVYRFACFCADRHPDRTYAKVPQPPCTEPQVFDNVAIEQLKRNGANAMVEVSVDK